MADGLLALAMQRANAAKRNIRGILSDPGGVLSQWGEQTAEDMTTPQQRARLAGGPFQLQDPALQQKMLELALQALTVYHGSPHKFAPEPGKPLGSFRSDKIGTGEGAQAYGYGHYVAESPGTAAFYKETNSPLNLEINGKVIRFPRDGSAIQAKGLNDSEYWAARGLAASSGMSGNRVERAVSFLQSRAPVDEKMATDIKKAIKLLENGKFKIADQGILYRADLADEAIPKMLDWDKPLSQQPKNVRKAFQNAGFRDMGATGERAYEWAANQMFMRDGVQVPLNANAAQYHQKLGSEFLSSLGIPGIRYLDAGSRGAGAGTHNYVVFPGNEGILSILSRE